ncbi:MAG: PIN domain-containing protein [Treponema sp.]|nr:PIN domain-containing protein [Candidatus Treponema caballi]
MKDMVLLIDTNVIMDVICEREEFIDDSKKVFDLCSSRKATGILAAHSIPNMFYILRKGYTDEQRREMLLSLFTYFNISFIDAPKLISALNRDDFRDFEDCLQNECAIEEQANCIITRNKKDFSGANVSVYTPTEFAALMKL